MTTDAEQVELTGVNARGSNQFQHRKHNQRPGEVHGRREKGQEWSGWTGWTVPGFEFAWRSDGTTIARGTDPQERNR